MAYVEMMVSGRTPQLPMSDGLTTAWAGFSSNEFKASWYI